MIFVVLLWFYKNKDSEMLNSHICIFKKQVEISTSKLRAFEDQGPSKKKKLKVTNARIYWGITSFPLLGYKLLQHLE